MEHKHEVAEEGGIQMLLKASEMHLQDAIVQAGVMGVLSNLSVDDEIERTIAESGGVEMLIKAAQAHQADAKVTRQGRLLLIASDCF